jgi:hypothetical protein
MVLYNDFPQIVKFRNTLIFLGIKLFNIVWNKVYIKEKFRLVDI